MRGLRGHLGLKVVLKDRCGTCGGVWASGLQKGWAQDLGLSAIPCLPRVRAVLKASQAALNSCALFPMLTGVVFCSGAG